MLVFILRSNDKLLLKSGQQFGCVLVRPLNWDIKKNCMKIDKGERWYDNNSFRVIVKTLLQTNQEQRPINLGMWMWWPFPEPSINITSYFYGHALFNHCITIL